MTAKIVNFDFISSLGRKKTKLKSLLQDPNYKNGRTLTTLVSKMQMEKREVVDLLNALGAKPVTLRITDKLTRSKKSVEGWRLSITTKTKPKK